tara:strand:- start:138 stop:299 length:162 start_codon:yes stop_codon:yes gene_type:complete
MRPSFAEVGNLFDRYVAVSKHQYHHFVGLCAQIIIDLAISACTPFALSAIPFS